MQKIQQLVKSNSSLVQKFSNLNKMCGISGLFNFTNRNIKAKKIISEIVKIQNLRGPDDNGQWQSDCKKVLFGHNRLSIIDLSTNGKQPFISLDNNFIITFNGEIYNFKEIKKN